MKILSVAWTIYDDRLKEFCTNCTGGGLVIKNLCEYIGKKEESYLFIAKYRLPEMMLGNIHIVGNDISDKEEDCDLDVNEAHLEEMTRAFKFAIEEIKPDVINIHGIGEFAIRCIHICQEYNIPCVFVEHLYIGLNKKFKRYDKDVLWEKELYSIPNLRIIAVSSGMKRKILNDYPNIKESDIHVIKNGTDFSAQMVQSTLKEKYGLHSKKVLLCVGTITERKNQLQVIDAFQLLPQKIKEHIAVIFCGVDRMAGRLQEEILSKDLEKQLIYIGAINSSEMKEYYSIANGLIMPSYAEGLSIAALEAISYGLPLIMFSDSECAEDLNDEKVSILADNRSSQKLANTIIHWYENNWDKKYIKQFSTNFTMERMADEYIEMNRELIENRRGKLCI